MPWVSRYNKLTVLAIVASTVFFVWIGLRGVVPGHTLLVLTDGETGRKLLSAFVRDGEEAALLWHNSLFDLDVTEGFIVEAGSLIQTAVTFADPRGLPPMVVKPEEVDEYFHTGGPFTASGLRRPFSRIVYRIGEIGNPRFLLGDRVIDFKQEVGFGGQVILSTVRPSFADFVR